jgi:signal transduction histidine kinase
MTATSVLLSNFSILICVALAIYLSRIRWRFRPHFSIYHHSSMETSEAVAELMRELSAQKERSERQYESLLSEMRAAAHDARSSSAHGSAPDASVAISARTLLAELTHSLKSPLLVLNGTANILSSLSPPGSSPETAQRLKDLMWGAQECGFILDTFHQLVDTSDKVVRDGFGHIPLPDAISALHDSANRLLSQNTRVTCEAPDEVPGFSADYLVTLLRPLIDNAVEASPPGEEIRVAVISDEQYVRILVVNAVGDTFDPQILQTHGASSKHAPPGLGLSVARRLAAMSSGGTLQTEALNGRVLVRVELPRRLR